MLTGDPVVDGARLGANASNAGDAVNAPSASDQALGVFESKEFNHALIAAPVVIPSIIAGAGAAAGGAGAVGVGGAAVSAAATAAAPVLVGLVSFTVAEAVSSAATNFVMDDLGVANWLGVNKITADGEQPSVLGHVIAHQHKDWGLWGALAAVAIGALAIATCGAGLAVVAAAAAVGGAVVGVASTLGQYGSPCGTIVSASTNVFFEGRGVARVMDAVACQDHGPGMLAEGCRTVFANERQIVRLGHRTTCDANVNEHVKTIFVTKETAVALPITDSRSTWLRWANVVANVFMAAVAVKGAMESVNPEGGIRASEEAPPPGEEPPTRTDDDVPIDDTECAADPVNMATGEYVEQRDDILVPGLLPIVFRRSFTNFSKANGFLGRKWSNSWSISFVVENSLSHFHSEDGCIITFYTPEPKIFSRNLKHPHLELRGEKGKQYVLLDRTTQLTYVFQKWARGRLWLSQIRDRNDNTIDFHYNDLTGLYAVCRSNGDSLEVQSVDWKIYRISMGGRELARYGYTERGYLMEAHSFQYGSLFYQYNARAFITSWRDTKATRVHYVYDGDRVTEIHSDTGQMSARLSYDDANRVSRVIDAKGAVQTFHHNGRGLVWRRIDARGGEWITERNLPRKITATIDPLGRRTSYSYNATGLLTAKVSPSGAMTSYSYDAQGMLIGIAEPSGATWTFERDERGNLARQTNPLGEIISFRTGSHGEVLRLDLPNGAFRSIYFDRALRPAAFRDGRGFERRVSIDALGRVLSTTDQEGNTFVFDYTAGPDNPRGALRTLRLPDGTIRSYEYDSEGQQIAATDGENRTTRFHTGAFDALEEIVDARGRSIKLFYDNTSNDARRIAAVVNCNRERYSCEYDPAGNLVREQDFGGFVTHYAYDMAGQRIAVLGPDKTQVRFSYDLDGRLLEEEFYAAGASEPENRVQYQYNKSGHLIRAQDRSGLVEIERDPLGRVLCERVNGREIRSCYDEGARSRTSRSGDVSPLAIAYDADGFVDRLQIGEHAPLRFQRNGRGYETRRASDCGFLLAQEWDSVGLLARQVAGAAERITDLGPAVGALDRIRTARFGVGVLRAYRWDRASNPLEIDDAHWGTTRYSYDVRGQVLEMRIDGGRARQDVEEHFSYDAGRNISSRQMVDFRRSGDRNVVDKAQFEYLPGGRVQRRGRVSYTFDQAGRVASKRVEEPGFRPKSWEYFWDAQGRLARCLTANGESWVYGYDPFGRRLWKRKEDVAANDNAVVGSAFQWDGDLVAAEAPIYADGRVAWDKVVDWHYEPDSFRPLAREEAGRIDYVVTDHLGTPRELLDETGAHQSWGAGFTLWGEKRLRLAPAPRRDRRHPDRFEVVDATPAPENDNRPRAELCPIRFQGQWEDEENGLFYNRFRYYDPQIGGYLSCDPIKLGGGLRLQGYVENPASWVDPQGLAPHQATISVYDPDGNLRYSEPIESGGTEPGRTLTWPEQIATHTESRSITDPRIQPGDRVVYTDATLPPCNGCRGNMNDAAAAKNLQIEYYYAGEKGSGKWVTNREKALKSISKRCK